MITRIRVPSRWQDDGTATMQDWRYHVADFQLGLGSCGKVVVSLDCKLNPDYVMICQSTEDGEIKDFYYPIATITGRVEITRK